MSLTTKVGGAWRGELYHFSKWGCSSVSPRNLWTEMKEGIQNREAKRATEPTGKQLISDMSEQKYFLQLWQSHQPFQPSRPRSWYPLQAVIPVITLEHPIYFLSGSPSFIEETESSEHLSQENTVWWSKVQNGNGPSILHVNLFRRPSTRWSVGCFVFFNRHTSSNSFQFHSSNIFWASKFFRTVGRRKKNIASTSMSGSPRIMYRTSIPF